VFLFSFHAHSLGNNIGTEGAIKLFEALKSNTTLTSLDLYSNGVFVFIAHSLGNNIATEGVLKRPEALESNSSLTNLTLDGRRLVASFDSHSIQIILLTKICCSNSGYHASTTTRSYGKRFMTA
jgi:hypothetical protein